MFTRTTVRYSITASIISSFALVVGVATAGDCPIGQICHPTCADGSTPNGAGRCGGGGSWGAPSAPSEYKPYVRPPEPPLNPPLQQLQTLPATPLTPEQQAAKAKREEQWRRDALQRRQAFLDHWAKLKHDSPYQFWLELCQFDSERASNVEEDHYLYYSSDFREVLKKARRAAEINAYYSCFAAARLANGDSQKAAVASLIAKREDRYSPLEYCLMPPLNPDTNSLKNSANACSSLVDQAQRGQSGFEMAYPPESSLPPESVPSWLRDGEIALTPTEFQTVRKRAKLLHQQLDAINGAQEADAQRREAEFAKQSARETLRLAKVQELEAPAQSESQARISRERKDAEQNNPALAAAFTKLFDEQDKVGAASALSALADQGQPIAEYWLAVQLGRHHHRGGVPMDLPRAFALFQDAAKRGYRPAIAHLGECYARGWGVAQDKAKAAEILNPAAKRGDMWAKLEILQYQLDGWESQL